VSSVFIVRPFGEKPVTVKSADGKDTTVMVDFGKIDRLLIKPALEKNRLDGQTTEVIAEAGNIRVDMFQMLIAADLVIADISIDNANVFYELGIRHGLRPKGTILLRFPTGGTDVPFDLKTDRYVAYDREHPEAAVDALANAIKSTIEAMHRVDQKADSPVFLLLPELRAPDPAALMVVPKEFQEEVERAENDALKGGPLLALLGYEAERNPWAREGIRLVGRAQRRKKSFAAARRSWESIRTASPNDIEANLQLATIYQRLGDLVASSQACRRVLADDADAERKDRADAQSQLGRNAKALWVAAFNGIASAPERRQQAIADRRLKDAFDGYMKGFAEDMNDYYSGINALGLLTAIVELAKMEPDTWNATFSSEDDAKTALKQFAARLADLRGAVRMSLQNAEDASKRTGKRDEWLPPSQAQYALLTSDRPPFVRIAYGDAKSAGGDSFSVSSEAAQVGIFGALGIFPENCTAALQALGIQTPVGAIEASAVAELSRAAIDEQHTAPPPRNRVVVATGHRVDAPGRTPPRFPNVRERIDEAKAWLRETLAAERAATTGTISGIAGAASGTDILFHEVCAELRIKTTVVLPIPAEDYRRESVADGGPDWVERFNRLTVANPPIILCDTDTVPVWVEAIPNYGPFQRGNVFVIETALLQPNADVTLLALWNGKGGDGPGGTGDMVALAQHRGAKPCVKNTDELFGLAGTP
jgi:Tetratricopeptide Repeats-Sensor